MEVEVELAGKATIDGIAVRMKFGALTVTAMVAVCDSGPLFAVTVTV